MKKNILSVIMIALLVISIVLDAVILFAVVPGANKTNELINKVASAVELEIDDETEYSIEDLQAYNFTEGNLTITLKKASGDKGDHYAVVTGISFSLNSKAEDYESISSYIASNEIMLKDRISGVIAKYDKEYAQNNIEKIKSEILELVASKKVLDSDTVVDVSFGNIAFQ